MSISPGVYSTITDLSTYVQSVPSSIGFICFLSKRGEDNKLKFFEGNSTFLSECGEPNIQTFGKTYGQGPYIANNFLNESGALYGIRCMPEDATYANIRIDVVQAPADATAAISITYLDSLNSKSEIKTNLTTSGNTYPLCVLYPIGRGVDYNSLGIRLTEYANPLLEDIYVLDIYERQSDGNDVIIESFEVSFNPEATDDTGDSIFIEYVLSTYSSILRCEMNLASEALSGGYDMVSRIYDKEIGTVTVVETDGSASIQDNKQDFSDWESAESGMATYMVVAMDSRGNKLYGWLGADDVDGDTINVFDGRDLTTANRNWVGTTTSFDATNPVTYKIKKSNASVASAFLSSDPVPMRKGSDGGLVDATGTVVSATATEILSDGYSGTLISPEDGTSYVDDVLDTENIYFNLVWDAGYPTDVKSAISTLVQTRRDCVAIMDNGDNASYTASINTRTNTHTFNNYFCTLYEPYNKVYDNFTGKDIWVSPLYHMSYIIPRNDRIAEIWQPAAGFDYAIDTIKDMRFNPRQTQRDNMYLKQLNPIVKFNAGYVPWGQLTSQSKPSALQDLNVVRTILYCDRALKQYGRYYIFKYNDSNTHANIANDVVQFLEDIKRRRGLYFYSVEVGANDYERKTKQAHCNVVLEPMRGLEKLNINFFVK